MSTYLVTGGCGFIGSHLVESLLDAGHQVRILDDLSTGKRENVSGKAEIMAGDVADAATVQRAAHGVEGIFHLAAIASVQKSVADWSGTHRVNLSGTINIFEAARTADRGRPVRVVYASSAAVYGDSDAMPISEESRVRPITAYGADKLGCEHHGRVATLIHNVPTTGFRFFNVYGPRQDPSSPYSGVISIFTSRVRKSQGLELFGDGQQLRDFVYVKDVVRFLRAAMDHESRDALVFNVCTGRPTTIRELAHKIMEVAGTTVEVRHNPPRPGDIRVSLGDPSAARRHFALEATTELSSGLKSTLESL
jgi:UDP-glucose 4-epimerase